jgi:hypothetical protein
MAQAACASKRLRLFVRAMEPGDHSKIDFTVKVAGPPGVKASAHPAALSARLNSLLKNSLL